ncbi:MAG TPA: hypothetical protein VGQ99_14850 [Tepidisphaeraceae bacterium]|nr:hypothetical protein [Tepidisphaeraceae bacterium]
MLSFGAAFASAQQATSIPQPAEKLAIPSAPGVISPPDTLFDRAGANDRDAARAFYKKYIDVNGMPVLASAEVDDLALQRTYDIVTHLLAGRPDVLRKMVTGGTRLIIIGKDQVYTDMPEYRNHPNPAYQNERVRGTGGFNVTSFGEENLLNLPLDRYDDESIGVHEFCHTIDAALTRIDPAWRGRLRETYQNAMSQGLWKNAYTSSNPAEYWAEICQSYFDCNRINNWNHAPIGTREQLRVYDPRGYELVRTTFALSPQNDWRYKPLRSQPSVTLPPAKFNIDPYYTKFTWAREFTIVGRSAGDEALLAANDIVRKMFAYRHDVLKALIADGVKLVVLAPTERISDLPEYKKLADARGVDALSRFLGYNPDLKLLAVGEENVIGDPAQNAVGDSQVIRVMASAIYHVTARRGIDPNWDSRPRNLWQQYELHLQRLDERLDHSLEQLYANAGAKGMWKGTAVHNRADYFVQGVLAYFDAAGQSMPPPDAQQSITTREALRQYDPELFSLISQTMAYDGHVDWRLPRRAAAR